ncbi:MAG: RIP metalloprotease RseP [Bacteroidales bacterium]|nr:RIP metalloprotease RseP [Bacteroidales bacterium]
MGVVIQIGQLLLSLSILVILHELGHFLFARLFKTRVEKFYLFFDPWFSLFKVKKGETEYGIGWLPFGGYVKISGMLDESMDKEQLKKPPQPYEFRSKPSWQRLLIMLGGVSVNLVLGIIIYAFVLYTWGEKYLPNQNLTDGIWCTDTLITNLGLENGDKVISINGNEPKKFSDIVPEIVFGGSLLVERNGEIKEINIPEDFIGKLVNKRKSLLLYPRVPFIIVEIPDTSINAKTKFKPLDRVVSLNNQEFKYYDQFKSIADTLKGQAVQIGVLRDNDTLLLAGRIDNEGRLGVSVTFPDYDEMEKLGIYDFEVKKFSFLESIPAGLRMAKEKLGFYIKQFKLIFNFKTGAYKGLGGFGSIGGLFPPTWEWQAFWEITAFLSLILAFMNILPIPALDGGHVTFLLYEMITGRKPSDKFMEYAQITGMIILLTLLLYANGNDLVRGLQNWFGK